MIEQYPPTRCVIGFPIAALPFDSQIDVIVKWAKAGLSKVVCIANVHMLVEGYNDAKFSDLLHSADMLTPDGMPLVWMLNLQGLRNQDRVAGLDVLAATCKEAEAQGLGVFFLGSHPAILEQMQVRLNQEYPNLIISGIEPLPFRPLTPEEDAEVIRTINNSGAKILFLSLGCPKQEKWMAEHKDKVRAVMIGLGGAFPVYAGIHRRAPQLVRSLGLEWLYRLIQEPKRLWKRYADTIPIFVWLALKQFFISHRYYKQLFN